MVPAVWALVTTAKAPLIDILKFCTFHLDQGAERIFLYLEEPDLIDVTILSAIPQIDVTLTDENYWDKKNGKPKNIASRQSKNVKDAYRRVFSKFSHIQWLGHLDVDEFIWTKKNVRLSRRLAIQPEDCQTLRLHPAEYLVPAEDYYDGPDQFKTLSRRVVDRTTTAADIFPDYGFRVAGGFVSHRAGKVLFRTQTDPKFFKSRIHNVSFHNEMNPGERLLWPAHILLAHYHTTSWTQFKVSYPERRQNGSYTGQLSKLFDKLDSGEHKRTMKDFFNDHCVASPKLIERLAKHNLYKTFDFQFEQRMLKYLTRSEISSLDRR